MRFIDTTTSTGGLEAYGYENGSFPIRASVPESVSEALAVIGKCSEDDVAVEAPEGALSAVLTVICAAWEQNAKQGGKSKIRDAMEEGDQDKVDQAVADHQKRAETYIMGAARGGAVGGVTKTLAGNVGKALREKLGPEGLLALAAEHGIDPKDLS